jgi:hypothetical protein
MTRRVNVTIIARSAGTQGMSALFHRIVDPLAVGVAQRGRPEPYDKVPGGWLIAAVLDDVPGEDSLQILLDLTNVTGLTGWRFDGDAGQADAVWDERAGSAATTRPNPELAWMLIEARVPDSPDDEPAETTELVPDPPGADGI